MAESKQQETIKVYVGDMASLESHIEEAIDRQVKLVTAHPKAAALVNQLHQTSKRHRDALKAHLDSMGGSSGSPVKEAVSAVLGVAAGVIDKVRPEAISKAIRDDYTAVNHATIGYTMLHATALMLKDQATASLAERHLRDYTSVIEGINQIIADVVAYDLRQDGIAVDDSAVAETTKKINEIWKQTEPAVR
jgi:ferritin-like metal-binding protein YciE